MFKIGDEVRVDEIDCEMYGEDCEIQAINGDAITLLTGPEFTVVKAFNLRPTTLAFNRIHDGEIFRFENTVHLKVNHEQSVVIGTFNDTDNYDKVHIKIASAYTIFRMDTFVKLINLTQV